MIPPASEESSTGQEYFLGLGAPPHWCPATNEQTLAETSSGGSSGALSTSRGGDGEASSPPTLLQGAGRGGKDLTMNDSIGKESSL